MTPGGELQKGVRFCYGGAACQLQEEEQFLAARWGAFQEGFGRNFLERGERCFREEEVWQRKRGSCVEVPGGCH